MCGSNICHQNESAPLKETHGVDSNDCFSGPAGKHHYTTTPGRIWTANEIFRGKLLILTYFKLSPAQHLLTQYNFKRLPIHITGFVVSGKSDTCKYLLYDTSVFRRDKIAVGIELPYN